MNNFKRTNQIKKTWKPQADTNTPVSQSSDNTAISDETRLESSSMEMSSANLIGTNLSSVTDAVVTVVEQKAKMNLPSIALKTAQDNLDLSIVNFLGKPYKYSVGTFQSTDGPSTFQFNGWSAGLSPSIIEDKMRGVLGINATLVLTLVANPNRFQRGRYILAYLPTGGLPAGNALDRWYTMHRYSKVQITQLPHVQFDIAGDTQVQLRIPYANALNYYPMNETPVATIGEPGFFFLYPYVALSSTAGSTTCGYTLFTHYEDIKLVGNTFPQSGWFPQSGRASVKKGNDLLAAETKQTGPITSGLRLVSSIASAMVTVPALSAVATPASWLLDAMANTAAWFGWSKPINVHHVRRVNQAPFPFMCNVDSQDVVAPLSLMTTNHVDVLPGFGGVDADELSIDYLKTIPHWYATYSWNTGQATGTRLLGIDVYPGKFSSAITDSNGNALQCRGPLAWLSDKFMYYSGSINIHIKLVKTEFHSGRLMLAFFPQESLRSTTDPTNTVLNYDYVHRELFDVRQANEITVNIPFISILNWRPTVGTGASYGWFAVMVQDPLTAPATVSSSIDFIIEVSGGPDLQFAVPKQTGFNPIVPSSLQSSWRPEAGETNVLVEEAIGSAELEPKTLELNALSIGEAMPSLRWLLKRGGIMLETTIATSKRHVSLPFAWNTRESGPAATQIVSDARGQSNDIYSELCQIYALSRGGVRIRYLPYVQGTGITLAESTVSASLQPTHNVSSSTLVVSDTPTSSVWANTTRGTNMATCFFNNGVQFQIPQYSFTHSRCNAAEMISTSVTYGSTDISSNILLATFTEPTSVPFSMYRSGADDCDFGLFVSIPPYI